MANREDNLIPFTSEQNREEAKKNGRKGGIASGEARRKKATMLSVLEKVLDETEENTGLTHRELATLGLVKGAEDGNGKNYEIIQNLMEKKEKSAGQLHQVHLLELTALCLKLGFENLLLSIA